MIERKRAYCRVVCLEDRLKIECEAVPECEFAA